MGIASNTTYSTLPKRGAMDVFNWDRDTIPDYVTLSIYMLIGIVGNTIVILVYKNHMNRSSEERYFIPVLAVSDMVACVTCSSLGIVWNYYQKNFTNEALCKVVYYFMGNSEYMSIFLLLCIAIQRYLKICKKKTLSLKTRRVMVLLCLLCAISFTIPLCLTYGIVHLKSNGTIISSNCNKLKYENHLVGATYGIVVSAFIFSTYVSFIILYGKIGFAIYKHFKKLQNRNANNQSENEHSTLSSKAGKNEGISETSQTEESESDITQRRRAFSNIETGRYSVTQPISNLNGKKKKLQSTSSSGINLLKIQIIKNRVLTAGFGSSSDNRMSYENDTGSNVLKSTTSFSAGSLASFDTTSDNLTPKKKKRNSKKKRNRRLMNKFSFMFMVVTTVFLVCFIPVSSILTLEGFYPDFWQRLSRSQASLVVWLYRTFIINNIANPFIYAFMDLEFRNAAKRLLRCL